MQELTLIQKSAVNIMRNTEMFGDAIGIEFLDDIMRGTPSVEHPIGPLVVKTKLTLFNKYEHILHIHYQILEDICLPMGDKVAIEFLWQIFLDDITNENGELDAAKLASDMLFFETTKEQENANA